MRNAKRGKAKPHPKRAANLPPNICERHALEIPHYRGVNRKYGCKLCDRQSRKSRHPYRSRDAKPNLCVIHGLEIKWYKGLHRKVGCKKCCARDDKKYHATENSKRKHRLLQAQPLYRLQDNSRKMRSYLLQQAEKFLASTKGSTKR